MAHGYSYGDSGPVPGRDLTRESRKSFITGAVRFLLIAAVMATSFFRFRVDGGGIQKEDLFKDWGHALVFTLIGLGVMGWWYKVGAWKLLLILAAVLTVVEVTAGVLTAKGLL